MSFLFKKRDVPPQSQNPAVNPPQHPSMNPSHSQQSPSQGHTMPLDQLSRLGLDPQHYTQQHQLPQHITQQQQQPMQQHTMSMSIPNYQQQNTSPQNQGYSAISQPYNMQQTSQSMQQQQPMQQHQQQQPYGIPMMQTMINQYSLQPYDAQLTPALNQAISSHLQQANAQQHSRMTQMPYYPIPTSPPHSLTHSLQSAPHHIMHQQHNQHSMQLNQPIQQSMNQLLSPSAINQSFNQLVMTSPINQQMNQPMDYGQSLNQQISQSMNQSMNQPMNQSLNQPMQQSNNQSNEQSAEQTNEPIPVIEDTPSEQCLMLRAHFSNLVNQSMAQSGTSSIRHHFEFGDTLGTGTFGRVRLVSYRDLSVSSRVFHFALKMLKKREILRLKQVEHIKAEKSILSRCCHPFIVSLYAHFQDESCLYMLMEYVIGGELFSQLRKVGRFSNDTARFYAAEIVLALQYLHSHDIVYRDLKPENLLIDREGHIKITDFGFAKVVTDRTWTLCGTPEYLAPEIIQSKGHGKSVDWWALGILIYEMIAGYPPFYDDNQFQIYSKILAGKIEFPKHFDPYAKDLVKKLLTADRSKRFGCLKDGADDVKRHRWFKGVDWIRVHCRRVKPPYVPGFASPSDTSNFDKYPDSDDDSETPLSQKEKDAFADF